MGTHFSNRLGRRRMGSGSVGRTVQVIERKRCGCDRCLYRRLVPDAKIPVAPGYQVPFAERIKQESGMTTGTVGLLTEATQMEELLETEKCDLVFLGRKLLRDPYFPINAAKELDAADIAPSPYSRRH